eukprot:Sdes_comp20304_c0_seq1m13921
MEKTRKRKVRFEENVSDSVEMPHFPEKTAKKSAYEYEKSEIRKMDATSKKKAKVSRLKTGVHSLDSDEESERSGEDDDADDLYREYGRDRTNSKYEILEEKDVEGAEEMFETIAEDDAVKITPFNLKEEMEEGHFDKEGNYYYSGAHKNSPAHEADAWADSFDWEREIYDPSKGGQREAREEEAGGEKSGIEFESEKSFHQKKRELFGQLVSHLLPEESVTKALLRLGSCLKKSARVSFAQRKRDKIKSGLPSGEPGCKNGDVVKNSSVFTGESSSAVETVTFLASRLFEMDYFDIYSETKESICALMEKENMIDECEKSFDSKPNKPSKIQIKQVSSVRSSSPPSKVQPDSGKNDLCQFESEQNIRWEFKWKSPEEDGEVFGPFSTFEMTEWKNQGFFDACASSARQICAPEKPFYPVNRIDFSLYD